MNKALMRRFGNEKQEHGIHESYETHENGFCPGLLIKPERMIRYEKRKHTKRLIANAVICIC